MKTRTLVSAEKPLRGGGQPRFFAPLGERVGVSPLPDAFLSLLYVRVQIRCGKFQGLSPFLGRGRGPHQVENFVSKFCSRAQVLFAGRSHQAENFQTQTFASERKSYSHEVGCGPTSPEILCLNFCRGVPLTKNTSLVRPLPGDGGPSTPLCLA